MPTAPAPRPAFKPPPLPLKGIGYNPTYATADVPREQRAERLRRDMAEMAQTGITMVLGWEPGVFDQELIDAAAANGIGVLLPFELRPEYNYAEPQTRAQLIAQALAWVERYRDQPAVIMWAIGNEVTLPMDGEQRRAYADFYAELFGRVHAADPTRPVIIREAEDVFVTELAEAFVRRGLATQRGDAIKGPDGFVYGVNFYTDRVGPALADWLENTGFDVPVLVSEYAPAGAGHRARADRFAQMHASIAAAGPRVIGSAPYTWTTIGPEAVDSYFGLVDGEGKPVDGALAELARLYGVEPPEWTRVTATDEQIARAAELPQLFDAALDVAKRQAARDPDTLRANAEAEAAAAVRELGVADATGVTAERTRSVAELIGWAKELSDLRRDDERLFPGLREALPLLNGMARWTAVEPSAAETARTFLATVLRRDLKALGD